MANLNQPTGGRQIDADVIGPRVGAPIGGHFSLNRVIAAIAPGLSILAGACAAWLWTHFPGLHVFGTEDSAARVISEAIVGTANALGSYAIAHKWLHGWQQYEQAVYDPHMAVDSGGNIGPAFDELDPPFAGDPTVTGADDDMGADTAPHAVRPPERGA